MFKYGATDFKICHFNVGVILCLSLKSQTCFPRVVSFLFDSFLKNELWLWNRFLTLLVQFLNKLYWGNQLLKQCIYKLYHLLCIFLLMDTPPFFLQLHDNIFWLSELISFLLCDFLWRLLEGGKCLSSNCRNLLATLVETLWVNGGLNHMIFRWRFCFVLDVISGWYFRLMLL